MDVNALMFRYLVYYPVVRARGQPVPAQLRKLLTTQYLEPSALAALQADKLRRLLEFARSRVPFYRRTLGPLAGAAGLASLSDVPPVHKQQIQSEPASFLAQERLGPITRKTTGGSTGEPMTVHKTRQAMAWELAATWRGYSWAGVRIGDRQARFWGVPIEANARRRARLVDWVANRRRCSAFAFDDRALAAYTERLKRFDPTWFYGYVSMIHEYAEFLRRTGTASPFRLDAIVTTSEVLTSAQRRSIEEVFRTRVFDEYGSGELGTVAHECEHGSLHVSAENMIVEVLDGDRPCEPNRVGELVVTELNNGAMPLIRYRTGDFAAVSGTPCRCGRTLPVLENVYGRAYDALRNRHGRVFHAEFMMYIFEEAQRRNLGIRAFQVVQEAPGAFRIRVVADARYGPATEAFVAQRIRDGFDAQACIRFERVDRIERLASGKKQLIVGMGNRPEAVLARA